MSLELHKGKSILTDSLSPMHLERIRLSLKQANANKPCTTDQKVKPSHASSQLPFSLGGVRNTANPLMEGEGDLMAHGGRKKVPFRFRDLKPQRRVEGSKDVVDSDKAG